MAKKKSKAAVAEPRQTRLPQKQVGGNPGEGSNPSSRIFDKAMFDKVHEKGKDSLFFGEIFNILSIYRMCFDGSIDGANPIALSKYVDELEYVMASFLNDGKVIRRKLTLSSVFSPVAELADATDEG